MARIGQSWQIHDVFELVGFPEVFGTTQRPKREPEEAELMLRALVRAGSLSAGASSWAWAAGREIPCVLMRRLCVRVRGSVCVCV